MLLLLGEDGVDAVEVTQTAADSMSNLSDAETHAIAINLTQDLSDSTHNLADAIVKTFIAHLVQTAADNMDNLSDAVVKSLGGDAELTLTLSDSMDNLTDAAVHDGNPNLLPISEDMTGFSLFQLDLIVNQADSPLEAVQTADLVIPTADPSFRNLNNIPVTSNVDYTLSFYAKSLGDDFVTRIHLTKPNTASLFFKDITITNSWQRFFVTGDVGAETEVRFKAGSTTPWDVGDEAYMWGFQINLSVLGSYKKKGASAVGISITKTDDIDNLADAVVKSLDVA